MNRRNFLKSLVTGIIGLTVSPNPIQLFIEPINIGPVGEFEYYITYYWEMEVLNPRHCGLITNIEIPEG